MIFCSLKEWRESDGTWFGEVIWDQSVKDDQKLESEGRNRRLWWLIKREKGKVLTHVFGNPDGWPCRWMRWIIQEIVQFCLGHVSLVVGDKVVIGHIVGDAHWSNWGSWKLVTKIALHLPLDDSWSYRKKNFILIEKKL